ncbi:dihydropteroate synthase [Alicyclobacillus cycloheptanicus]|uniref:Dihydropteroate synthase n=1 Tax=Alicyclobacillus cycloheptanicus TaxID=1457 RepID=A0ABT9XIJ0_9BACL|nr:dihydropteroate synthase [Alicyclobacillus cycloheptanicus]MDQ0190134.1 dihydropteroate synthase [Alicyclobacillus cycloheptanicus]
MHQQLETGRDPSSAACGLIPAPNRVRVMGIVNVTPDSFSDGGVYFHPSAAIRHGYRLMEEGADILDIGGESTRPGSTPVEPEEEWARLCPVLQELCGQAHFPVSVDTYHADTAAKAIEAGAAVINDIWGGQKEPDLLRVVAEAGCGYVWMHNREAPAEDPFEALMRETEQGIERCLEAGVAPDKLWIDPGIGFGKTYEHNLTILKRLKTYCGFPYPVLLGVSRKRFIGLTLGVDVDERLEGSLAVAAAGVLAGVRALRVHDVRATVRLCRMIEAIQHAD